MDGYGDFVVVWAGQGADDNSGVYAQVFDNQGYAVGNEFLVNQTTLNIQDAPAVAMDNNGDFVVTWSSYGQTGSNYAIFGRLFTPQGLPASNEFQVNTSA